MEKVVILLGGGIDSTTVLASLLHSYGSRNIYALFIDYGQKALEGELASCNYFCHKYGVPLVVAKVEINKLANCAIMKGTKVGESSRENILEGRNAIFIAMAVTYATSIGAKHIYTGFHLDDPDTQVYPDCTPKFAQSFNNYVDSYLQPEFQGVRLCTPFNYMTREDIVKYAVRLDVEILKKSFTCYEEGTEECGECVHCKKKKQLIKTAGLS